MDVARESGEVGDPPDMVLAVENRLVQVGDRPALRDGVAEQPADLLTGRPRDRVAPRTERGQQPIGRIQREVAVHHRRHTQGADGPQLDAVAFLHVRG